MSNLEFVELPARKRKLAPIMDALAANPGKWIVWDGTPQAAYAAAKNYSKNGRRYEATQVDGVAYVRAVAS